MKTSLSPVLSNSKQISALCYAGTTVTEHERRMEEPDGRPQREHTSVVFAHDVLESSGMGIHHKTVC